MKGTVSPPILTLASRQPVASRPVFPPKSKPPWGECSRRTIRSPVEIPGDSKPFGSVPEFNFRLFWKTVTSEQTVGLVWAEYSSKTKQVGLFVWGKSAQVNSLWEDLC